MPVSWFNVTRFRSSLTTAHFVKTWLTFGKDVLPPQGHSPTYIVQLKAWYVIWVILFIPSFFFSKSLMHQSTIYTASLVTPSIPIPSQDGLALPFWSGRVYDAGKTFREPDTSFHQWLGMIWNTSSGALQVLPRRIDKLLKFMQSTSHLPYTLHRY